MFLATVLLLLSTILHAKSPFLQSPNAISFGFTADSLQASQMSIDSGVRGLHLSYDSLELNVADSLVVTDTINNNDTLDLANQSDVQDIINYKATDSIVYDLGTKKMYLYNEGDLSYQKIALKANRVDFDWNTMNLTARGTIDSNGNHQIGTPIFSEDGKEYRADSMKYNFKTKKGIVYHVLTKEGDAYIHSEVVKKNEFDEWYGQRSKYTTCDLDEPHFFFRANRVKIVPGKVMVTGPANLWVGGVPTPLYLPFGIFPVKQGQRSGIILPQYGQIGAGVFFLQNGGYYWAVNDYLGLKFLAQFATNGTVGAGINAQYALRYKFTGSVAFNYVRTPAADPDLPKAKATNAYFFSWNHTQDSKSIPNSTFGASVQMQSADYYNASFVTDSRVLNTSFNSSVNFAHNFVGSPFSLAINLRHDQNLLTHQVNFGLPTIRLSMSRVTPFKSKIQTGVPKWYENIGISYSFEFQNKLSTFDSILFKNESANKFTMGVNQQVAIDAPLKILKYLNVTPAFNYQERTYFKGVEKSWDSDTTYSINTNGKVDTIRGHIVTDTVWKFNSTRNFSLSLSLSTKVTGIFKFRTGLVKAIRHTFTPSVSFAYNPDFGNDLWKYYKYVQGNSEGAQTKYSVFETTAIYGVPGAGQVAQLSWNLANNFDMKIFDKKDTVNHEKKVGLLDQVNLNGGYNFIADSLRLQPFNLSVVAARIFNLINLNFSAQFDPYAVDSHSRRINTFEWTKTRTLLRFASANVGATMSLHSKPRTANATNEAPPKYFGDYVSYNPNQIYNFDIPWNLSLGYNFVLSKGYLNNPDTIITNQSIRASADFNLTPHWKIAVSTGFDISRKQMTLTNLSVIRDLHCWELTFTWTPPLNSYARQQFLIILQPKSGTLKDLKLQKKNSLKDL